jgi:NAD(P)-dependent dehydrogenase (short-subunit alcohol dehydrogenase family)
LGNGGENHADHITDPIAPANPPVTAMLQDKVAIVTGAGGGIGRAAALVFAREGALLIVSDRDEESLAETTRQVQAAGGTVTAVAGDVSRRDDVKAIVAAALDGHGRLDCAFNNAGISGPLHPLVGYPDAEFERVIDVNVKGTWYCLQEELPVMIEAGGGAIVNTSSGMGVVAAPGMPAYVASKHAVMGLTQSAALENAAFNVRVNAVLPGIVDTRMPAGLAASAPGLMDVFRTSAPLGRLAEPHEVAETAAWLCSDRASFVTGHGLAVDGGILAQ